MSDYHRFRTGENQGGAGQCPGTMRTSMDYESAEILESPSVLSRQPRGSGVAAPNLSIDSATKRGRFLGSPEVN